MSESHHYYRYFILSFEKRGILGHFYENKENLGGNIKKLGKTGHIGKIGITIFGSFLY